MSASLAYRPEVDGLRALAGARLIVARMTLRGGN